MSDKLLFCGTNVPDTIEYKVKYISAAGNRFQNNVIANLKSLSYEIKNLSFIGVPLPDEIITELKSDSLTKDYLTYPKSGFASILGFHKLLKQEINDSELVMCYNITYAWLLLPFICRKKRKKSCVILADYSGVESYTSLFRKLYAKAQLLSLRNYDLVVGLSANIHGKLKAKQKFILMEGGIDDTFYRFFNKPKVKNGNEPVVIMYSGLLSKVTGVDLLLEAITKTDHNNVRFVITGKGDLEEQVKKAAKEDDRIDFKGHLSYENYMEELQSCDILINPRNMNLPENQNNFPSKIMDYIATGKLIISTKFVGWERFEETIAFCQCDENSLAFAIQNAISESEKGNALVYEKNREFASQFAWNNQINKIMKQLTGV